MDNIDLHYQDFLNGVSPEYQGFARQTHGFLLENGYKIKIDLAKSGYVVSYSHIKTKKVIVNFVFRKGRLVIRIYGNNVNGYIDFMQTLPEEMIKMIEKASVCKRLVDLAKCNSRCPMGYDFSVKGDRYIKCRYNCFMFEINAEHIPFIKTFIENEVTERAG